MSKSNAFETALLKLILQNVAIAGVADALAVPGNLLVSGHTADPGEAGGPATNECAYDGYARVAVPRSAAEFDVTGNVGTNINPIVFPLGGSGAGGGVAMTHWGLSTSAGVLLYKGALSTPTMTGVNVAPVIDLLTITED